MKKISSKTWLLMLLMLGAATMGSAGETALKPRLVVCTDIAPGDVEPDDMESMVHLMAYADMFEIEALITSVGWNCDPYPKEWAQYLYQVIDAYAQDVKNLMKRSEQTAFLSLKEPPKPDDTADALAIAVCHAHSGASRLGSYYNKPTNMKGKLK